MNKFFDWMKKHSVWVEPILIFCMFIFVLFFVGGQVDKALVQEVGFSIGDIVKAAFDSIVALTIGFCFVICCAFVFALVATPLVLGYCKLMRWLSK